MRTLKWREVKDIVQAVSSSRGRAARNAGCRIKRAIAGLRVVERVLLIRSDHHEARSGSSCCGPTRIRHLVKDKFGFSCFSFNIHMMAVISSLQWIIHDTLMQLSGWRFMKSSQNGLLIKELRSMASSHMDLKGEDSE